GERAARRVGATLRALGHHPDLVLCSPAERTRRTAELALAELPSNVPVDVESDLYGAYADELLGIVRATAPDVGTLLLVGHNPGVHELVMWLTTRTDDPGFPTGSFAEMRDTGESAELPKGVAIARWSPRTGRPAVSVRRGRARPRRRLPRPPGGGCPAGRGSSRGRAR